MLDKEDGRLGGWGVRRGDCGVMWGKAYRTGDGEFVHNGVKNMISLVTVTHTICSVFWFVLDPTFPEISPESNSVQTHTAVLWIRL